MTSETTTDFAGSERFNDGLAVRRKVLGDAHVDRSLNNMTEFSRPMQELVTEYCWGAVWTRDGLEHKTRSLINLAMLTVLNRHHELAAHVRGAVNNGVTDEEMREVFMQTAIYAGVPAALESFRIAEETLTTIRDEG